MNSESSTPNGENNKWSIVKHTRVFHRKTYVRGRFISKFYGELDFDKEVQKFVKEKYYDFTLYEAEIVDAKFRVNNEGPFSEFDFEDVFKGRIRPNPLPCKILYKEISGEYEVILHDVKLANIDFNKHRELHQEEDNQVFGTVEAEISGFLLEELVEEYDVKVEVQEKSINSNHSVSSTNFLDSNSTNTLHKTNIKTGKTKIDGQYEWEEFWYSDKKTTYWGNPKFTGKTQNGCMGTIFQIIGLIFAVLSIVAMGPQAIISIISIFSIGLIISYLSEIIKWFFRISAILMILFFIVFTISSLMENKPLTNIPVIKDDINETKNIKPDTINITDSLIVHHRIWKDYNGKQYEGNIWVKLTDFRQSKIFKINLRPQSNNIRAYDTILSDLKKQDESKMGGVYKLLDSIRVQNSQNYIEFAETIVSFVQDMPYAIVLDNACDPKLYEDKFTQAYLKNTQANCDGFQKFGINSPVEFIGTLKGDCDTRTLLLYTLLSHYKYDVAILSSEIYSHSILAINLPFNGKAININNKRYVVWETTAPDIRAGLLPEDISNFNNWRISLLSKP